jgi:hypothetical protein
VGRVKTQSRELCITFSNLGIFIYFI